MVDRKGERAHVIISISTLFLLLRSPRCTSSALVLLLLDLELLPRDVVLAPLVQDVPHSHDVEGLLPAHDERLLRGGTKVRGARVQHRPGRVVRVHDPQLADPVEQKVVALGLVAFRGGDLLQVLQVARLLRVGHEPAAHVVLVRLPEPRNLVPVALKVLKVKLSEGDRGVVLPRQGRAYVVQGPHRSLEVGLVGGTLEAAEVQAQEPGQDREGQSGQESGRDPLA
mmetsp:Transcript_92/g.385  ORF Transcript_92/g.385 Transcript_92/m.385 type:complete len:226 (+) Transcript_92:73-750(+)